jgi:hypothetical protein
LTSSMAVTDFFTCLRVLLKRLCVAFLSSIAQRNSKSSRATTTAEGKERGNEREKTDPTGFSHPLSSQYPGPQITSSNLHHCKICIIQAGPRPHPEICHMAIHIQVRKTTS